MSSFGRSVVVAALGLLAACGSGEAERAGVADACRTKDLPVLEGGNRTQVACHWATATVKAAP